MTKNSPQPGTNFDWRIERCGDPVMIVSHRRSGTHLLIDLIRRQFPETQSWKYPGQNAGLLYISMGGLARGIIPKPVVRKIIARPKRPILKTHSLPTFDLQQNGFEDLVTWTHERGQIVYVVRDCRAVMASLYAYMQSFDAKARVSPSEFLRQTDPLPEFTLPAHAGLSRPAQWALHVQQWRARPDALCVRFEDALRSTRETLDRIGAHLHMQPRNRKPLLPERFSASLLARMGQHLSMRPASTAIITPGAARGERAWRDLFSADDLAFIVKEAGDALADCGYMATGE